MLLGTFVDQVVHDIDFTDEAIVQCNVPIVKMFFLGDGNLQLITNKFWYEYLMYCSWTQFCV